MKKLQLSILLTTLCFTGLAQGFETGSEWVYSYWIPRIDAIEGDQSIKLNAIKTRENTTLFQFIRYSQTYVNHTGETRHYRDTLELENRAGVLYYDKENVWFDLNMELHDTMTINRHRYYPETDSLFDLVVDSVYYNEVGRKTWVLKLAQEKVAFSFYNNELIYLYDNMLYYEFIDGIGYTYGSGFIPFYALSGEGCADILCLWFDQSTEFLCFKNWNTGETYSKSGACTFLSLDEQPEVPFQIKLIGSQLIVEGTDRSGPIEMSLFSSTGQLLQSRKILPNETIPIDNIASRGLIIVKLESSNAVATTKIFLR